MDEKIIIFLLFRRIKMQTMVDGKNIVLKEILILTAKKFKKTYCYYMWYIITFIKNNFRKINYGIKKWNKTNRINVFL